MPDSSGRQTTPCPEPDCGVESVSGSGTPSTDYCSRECYDRAQAGRETTPEVVEREREVLRRMLDYDVPPHIDRDAALWGAATVLLLLRESPPARTATP